MAAQPEMAMANQMQALAPDAREALGRLADENALLRASLAQLQERLRDLEQATDRDALTGLGNRRSFLTALDRVVSQANRHGTPAALVQVALDGMPAINDRHGCLAGDAALSHVARLLSGLVRTSDFAARTGGIEFSLLLDHLDQDSAIETAERIAGCIARSPLDLGGAAVAIDVAVAVTGILRGDRAEEILGRAARNLERVRA